MQQDNSNNIRFRRRQLLAATGLGGAALFLPSLFGGRARAQNAPIKRLVIMTQHHGTVQNRWRMLRDNKDYGNWEYAFDDADPKSFSTILQPLHPHRADLLVLDGLSQASSLGDKAINNHNTGHLHVLTGAQMIDDMNSGGPTVDQIIAHQVALSGRIPSLEMATRSPWIGGMINLAASQRAPVETSPGSIFDRLFPNGSAPAGKQQAPTERDQIRSARKSVLDFVSQEYGLVSSRLGKEDRARLDMHRELIRDLEMRVGALSSLSCTAPDGVGNGGNQLDTAKAFADMTAAAFACDLTRVATIQIQQLDNDEFGAPPGDVHQDFAHQTDTDDNAAEQMGKYNAKHAEVFGYLLDGLKRYTDGNGTLLDSTAVVWVSELAVGPHDLDKIPIVMAGSCGGYFRTGRYVSYAQDLPNPHEHPDWGDKASRPIGLGHSHLLISLMQAMGLSNNTIGSTSVVTRDGKNTTIDLTGPLPRLT
jgi:hypothetical protein